MSPRTYFWVSTPAPHLSALLARNICNTLQHTATHCNTLQHTATHCNTLQHSATRWKLYLLRIYAAVCCRVWRVLLCGAVWCSVVQRVAACCSMLQCVAACVLQYAAVCCSVLQCVTVCCSVLREEHVTDVFCGVMQCDAV